MPTAVVVKKGHKLALLITSQDSRRSIGNNNCFSDYRGGCYNPSGILPATTVNEATNTIYLGKGGTTLELDWVDPRLTNKAPTQ